MTLGTAPVVRGTVIPPRERRRDRAVPLYEDLARRFAAAIEAGVLRPGDRLPSVRALRAQERLSTATVMQALARLELLGLVEARPRSGTFVRARPRLPPPAPSRPPSRPRPVTVAPLVARVVATSRDPRLVPLGFVAPAPELVPARALARAMSAVMREPRCGTTSPRGSRRSGARSPAGRCPGASRSPRTTSS
jgi:DNA-binding transcriptional MocR family regulator